METLYNQPDYFRHASFFNGSNNTIYGYADYFAERMNRQKRYAKIVRQCLKLFKPKAKGGKRPRLLEVGCGPGYFLEVAHKAGFEVCGVEFNKAIVEQFSERYPFPIYYDDYSAPNKPDRTWDCLVMLDVLEHFADPYAVLQKACQSLHMGGLLVISTVDAGSVMSRLIGKRLEDFRRTREHLYFFNRYNISILLNRTGFRVISQKSIGHTFLVKHLYERLALMAPALNQAPRRLGKLFSFLGEKNITINPGTKMIVYAEKN